MTAVTTLGLVCITIVNFQILKFLFRIIYDNFLAIKLKINAANFREVGSWAVVTGATDGIGKAYAELLAEKGKNIVLISRTPEKLEAVARDIAAKTGVETKTIAADFTNTEKTYHDIDKQLTGLDIGILVNNVGMSYPYPEYFHSVKDDELYTNIVNCNIFSVIYMTKLVLPTMLERKRGIIINLSSSAAQIPSPMLAVYSASKAFVDKFSEDLLIEYSKYGIIVQSVLPGYVATNMSKIKKSTWMAPTPRKYVAEALSRVGVLERTTGYFPHSLLVGVLKTIEAISVKLSRWIVLKTMQNIRSRALKRVNH